MSDLIPHTTDGTGGASGQSAAARTARPRGAAGVGHWTIDPRAGMHTRDASLNRLLGLAAAETAGALEEFFAHIHPDDRGAVRAAVGTAVRGATPLRVDFRVPLTDGSVRWLRTEGSAGGAQALAGVCVDVTDLKGTEAALRTRAARYRAIAANLPNGAAVIIGPDLRCLLAEGEAFRLLGFSVADFEGKTLAEAFGPELAAVYEPHYRAALAGEPFRVERAAHRRHFITHGVPLREDSGKVVAALAVSYDITDRVHAEEAARTGAERLQLILASATDHAIFTLAPDLTVSDWSPGAEAVFGYTAAEIVGRPVDELFTPEDRAAGVPGAEVAVALRTGSVADERWHLRKGAERFFASGALTPLAGGRGFVKVLRDLSERKRMEDELRQSRDLLEEKVAARTQELAAALESRASEMLRRTEFARRLGTAQEEERQRLARDLHDTVGQTLTGLALAAAAGQLEQVRRLADELSRELHDVAVRLRPTALDDLGLAAAARELAAEWSARAKVPVDFQAVGPAGDRLPREIETALYRVVQEALTNAARYAGARRVAVVVGRRGDEAVAVIEDDGYGFDPESVPRAAIPGRRGGLGLIGMRERVDLLGGELEIDSAPGSGTTIIARIPLGELEGREPVR
ncbi:PAS domain S-box protein [Gemmata sp. JC673]|uniref:Oxygen sensor histidine kinase NreB n=1 Tax=Gemmata algarum TaxID=2975278 RepID=A0ABU5F2E5_9BACT|nr:PAS domain S-box protein [Gemmata algarum]MDY3561756.1 PAS domain S-box protein [Gemmata algarum]